MTMDGTPTGEAHMADRERDGLILDVTPGHEAFERDFLETLGHPVLVCHGPRPHECPLIEEGSCEMLDAAHGVVFQLDLDREYHREILDRYTRVLPEDVPVRVVVAPDQVERHTGLLDRVQVWTHEPTAGELDGFAAQVEAADANQAAAEDD